VLCKAGYGEPLQGTVVDPYGGACDLAAGVLRHVSPAFAEDPLRVLRVARFAARFGFSVVPETEALLRTIVASGALATLAPERVWQELARGLMEAQPSRMLAVLRDCGALAALLPEVDALFGVPQPPIHHPEVDTGVHVMMVIDARVIAIRWEPQEEGMMSTAASFPSVRNQGLIDQ
jgi:tRNA nucleotidyltransferase (CCA-adding enzyme)